MVAVDGIPLDPNPRRLSHIYKQVQGRFAHALSNLPVWGQLSQVLSKTRVPVKFTQAITNVQIWGKVFKMFRKVNRKRRVRKRNALGKVVGFAAQEIRGYPEAESSVDKNEDVVDN